METSRSCHFLSGPHLFFICLILFIPWTSDKTALVSAPCVPGWVESWPPCCTSCGASARWLPWCFAACVPCWAPPSPSCCRKRPTSTYRTQWRTWRGRISGLAPPSFPPHLHTHQALPPILSPLCESLLKASSVSCSEEDGGVKLPTVVMVASPQ